MGSVSSFLGRNHLLLFQSTLENANSNDVLLRQIVTAVDMGIAGLCYLTVYAVVHKESPFVSWAQFLFSRSPGSRVVQWWIAGLSAFLFLGGLVRSFSSGSGYEMSLECGSEQPNRFYSWVMDIACGSTLHEQGLLLHFFIAVFYLAVVSLAFLLLHYLQHIQRLSNLFSLTLGGTFLFLLVSFPPFVRSVHILIQSITLLLDVVSFPLYTVLYEAFPTPLIRILSIGMKMITILYSIEQSCHSIRCITRQVRSIVQPDSLDSNPSMRSEGSTVFPLLQLWIHILLVILQNPFLFSLALVILQSSLLETSFSLFFFPCLFVEYSLCWLLWESFSSWIDSFFPSMEDYPEEHLHQRWKGELQKLGIWSFSFSADSVLRILYRVISRFLSKVKQIPDILLFLVFVLLDYICAPSIRGSLVLLAAIITVFMILMISCSGSL
ncbi:hypothetical protein WA538_002729 [Blastocystis sp. DL]